METQKNLIDRFLHARRIAVVGVSRNPKDFTRSLWKQFRVRGYDAVPVHPELAIIDGIPCYRNVQAIDPRPECALILVSKDRVKSVLEDCLTAGIRTVWIYGIRGRRDVESDILEWCYENDIEAIAGHCPLMFLADTPFYHRLHGAVWKVLGYYPN